VDCKVHLTEDASQDIVELYDYIALYDTRAKADYVLNEIEKLFMALNEMPKRGSYPEELLALGIREYRELYFKPYRIIYRIIGEAVFILLITDGRRDMQSLLERRLISG